MDAAGDIFIADSGNNVVREVKDGVITTVAGNYNDGNGGYSGDGGPAISGLLSGPVAVAVDPAGNLFIADSGNCVVREVLAAAGTITPVAGNGTAGYSGDGGAATNAELCLPYGLAVDAAGNLIIGDTFNSVIREVGSVAAVNTTLSVASSTDDPAYGQSVTFTATVNPPYLGGNHTSGTVTFYDNGNFLGSASVISG